MKFDLHLHTTASDGRLTPAELVDLAVKKGIEVIAITDHDSVSGVEAATAAALKYPELKVIPGVEINTDYISGEVHVLGYFINYHDRALNAALEKIRESRVGRAQKMINKLNDLDLHIEWARVQELARGESICRPHIAQALLEKGYIESEKEAFDRYIGRNGPAYVERDKVKPTDAVAIILRADGLPVLAHPAYIDHLDKLIIDLKNAGLVGLEAYYGEYNESTISNMVGIAKKYGLLTTGGSDYHHFLDGRETAIGSVDIPTESIEKLYTRAGRHFTTGWN
ncbi:MAG: PHP domain-containing protein [Dehalococcoidia bacterium]|nr:PHP domain-containing protein [Dehalococcoidia bacterium]MDD5493051.1 PHP domain-containing protein [Dehalococcoidia bacterium]